MEPGPDDTRSADRTTAAGRTTVYAATHLGQLSDPVVDGDVAVVAVDWTLLRELRGDELLSEIGTLDSMPPALVELARRDVSVMTNGDVALGPVLPGKDGPWAYIAYVGGHFGEADARASDAVWVCCRDWAMAAAEVRFGAGPVDWAAFIDGVIRDMERLGPSGRSALATDTASFLRAFGPEESVPRLLVAVRDVTG